MILSKKQISLFLLTMIFTFNTFSMGARRSKSPQSPLPQLPITVVERGPYVEHIKDLVKNSACANYNFKDRGTAPIGYIKGVALSFARSFCRLKKIDSTPSALASILSAANTKNKTKDALSHYESEFSKIGVDVNKSGVEALRALYVLGMGLGMRESSGKYCEGYDVAAGSNRSSSAAEAGVFQTSYDSISINSELEKLYAEYKTGNSNRCLLDIFSEGVNCKQNSILGKGPGAEFQVFTKSCPVFATEYAMTLLRLNRTHYGPINRKEAQVRVECDQLLTNVQNLISQDIQSACQDIY